jgi:hypothetical protein
MTIVVDQVDVSLPFLALLARVDADDAGGVVRVLLPVAMVLIARQRVEICPSVVVVIPVNMINLIFWELARYVQEGEPVRQVASSVYRDPEVSFILASTCHGTCTYPASLTFHVKMPVSGS